MIVKISFNDNDYTNIIKEFLDKAILMNMKYCLNKYRDYDDGESVRKYLFIKSGG